jgi:enoyl-CoA hydratase/carnithine racemase
MADTVELRRDGAVAVLTLSVPDKRNALTVELRRRLIEALEDLDADASCRAVVLTGAGGTFCSGGDISTMAAGDPLGARHRLALAHRVVRLLVAGRKPVVAAVEGYAFGAGFSLATACDVVVAGAGAKFCASFGRIGLMPDLALLWTLPQRVGLGPAKELMMLCDVIDGAEAARLGAVDHVVEDGAALDAALEKARRLAAGPPLAIALTKAAFARAPADLETLLAIEADGQALLFQTADHAEARSAFFAKRQPVFEGR